MERMRMARSVIVLVAVVASMVLLSPMVMAAQAGCGGGGCGGGGFGGGPGSTTPSGTIDPTTIPKYSNQIAGPPPVYTPTVAYDPATGALASHDYTVRITAFTQQVLPSPMPKTSVWGYGGMAEDPVTGASLGFVRNSPAPSFEAERGVPINVKWVNELTGSHMFAVDPTVCWANPNMMPEMPEQPWPPFPPGFPEAQSPVTIVPHLHGGEVQSTSDGHPEAWWTECGMHGMMYGSEVPTDANAAVFHYPNGQPATTLWYHDHALGITRINVMSGLAGFYLLRDKADAIAPLLPQGKYDMPIVLQDRTFKTDGSFWFPTVGSNPTVHPYWVPMSYGNTAMINGLVWPNMNVDKGQYMFRLLDGSNARFYTVSFTVASTGARLPFTQIASDGGYLRSPVTMTSISMAPGERATVLVDFSSLAAGTKVVMTNSGNGCGGSGMGGGGGGGMGMMAPSIPELMQFTVKSTKGQSASTLPKILNKDLQVYPSLSGAEKTRVLTLTQGGGSGMMNCESFLCDGQPWMAPLSEIPSLGSTEVWQFVNPTMMTHPMHMHLVQFQVVSRQSMDMTGYYSAWVAKNGPPPLSHPTVPISLAPYLTGSPTAAPANEQGWKDTVKCYPGQVTTVIVRFAPIDGSMMYPFDATEGPGYVWHCHIIDHEDNEMMRPYAFMDMPMPMGM